MSYCISVVAVNPRSDPKVAGESLFDRPPLSEDEQTVWATPLGRKPFPVLAAGRRRMIGSLIIEEALQAPGHACYIPGLHAYYPGDWNGSGFFLYADTGKRYPLDAWVQSQSGAEVYDSKRLVRTRLQAWDEERKDPERGYWGNLAISPPYRDPANLFLQSMLEASQDSRIFVVCEYNGNVTDYHEEGSNLNREEPIPNPETQLLGPISLDEFWQLNDAEKILIPSLTSIDLPMT